MNGDVNTAILNFRQRLSEILPRPSFIVLATSCNSPYLKRQLRRFNISCCTDALHLLVPILIARTNANETN
jgi:hypothetical protein